MARQHAHPILLPVGALTGTTLDLAEAISELEIQLLVQSHPECLPIAEIDTAFLDPVPICRELGTPAGPIDNFMVTARGSPVLVECKLWRNPQARREVVGQVLDYAKELSRWTSADIDREVRRRGVPSLIEAVRSVHPEVDEADFNDALSRNLARGRCLLLIVGDGIREGVEAIFEHLRAQSALQFSLGLVELPIYRLPDGAQLVVPRVLARTAVEVRRVVELPPGTVLLDDDESRLDTGPGAPSVGGEDMQAFWRQFFAILQLDDPEQPLPRPPRQGFTNLPMPAPGGSCWLNIYRVMAKGHVGIFPSWNRGSIGERAAQAVIDGWNDTMQAALGGEAQIGYRPDGRTRTIYAWKAFGDLNDPDTRTVALTWLAAQTNQFVNYFRPAIRSAVRDIAETEG